MSRDCSTDADDDLVEDRFFEQHINPLLENLVMLKESKFSSFISSLCF